MNHDTNATDIDTPTAEQLFQRLKQGEAFLQSPDYAAFLGRWCDDEERRARTGGTESPGVATERAFVSECLDAAMSAPTGEA